MLQRATDQQQDLWKEPRFREPEIGCIEVFPAHRVPDCLVCIRLTLRGEHR